MANNLVSVVNRDWLEMALREVEANDGSATFDDPMQGIRDEDAVHTIAGLLLVQKLDGHGVPIIGEEAAREIVGVLNEYSMRTLEAHNHFADGDAFSQEEHNSPDTLDRMKACFARACQNVKVMISDPEKHRREIVSAVAHLQMSLGNYNQMKDLQASVFSAQNKLDSPK